MIFHSGRSIQYASKKFTNGIDSYEIIKRNRIRKVKCWGNTVTISFFKTFKTEQIIETNLKIKTERNLKYSNIFKFGTTENEDVRI